MIVFDESLRLGIEEMDAEHKTLVDMLNHLQSLLKEGKRTEAMHYFNEVLLSYVETHLSHEEAFLEQIGYPELESHKKIHEVY
ncbi:MAG: bacteriohemerythrin, partial [Aquificaceae bacterium]